MCEDHANWWAEVEVVLAAFEGMPEHIEREQDMVREFERIDGLRIEDWAAT